MTKTTTVRGKQFNKFSWLKDVCRIDVSKEALCCATVLFNYADQDGSNCYPSYLTLENEAKLSDKGVKKGLKELLFSGLLTIDKHGQGNQYTLLMAHGWEARIASGYKFERTKKPPRGGRQIAVQDGRCVNAQGSWKRRVEAGEAPCGAGLNHLPRDGITYQDHIITKSKNTSDRNIPAASQKDSGLGESGSIQPTAAHTLSEHPSKKGNYVGPDDLKYIRGTQYVPGIYRD